MHITNALPFKPFIYYSFAYIYKRAGIQFIKVFHLKKESVLEMEIQNKKKKKNLNVPRKSALVQILNIYMGFYGTDRAKERERFRIRL